MKWRSIRGIPRDQVVREVVVDIGRDLLGLTLLFLVIFAIGQLWPIVGSVGRWVFLVAVVVLGAQFFFGCLVGLADSVLEGAEGGGMEGSGLVILATAARIVELGVALLLWSLLMQWFG